jgi:preprotein translocase subunit YajC
LLTPLLSTLLAQASQPAATGPASASGDPSLFARQFVPIILMVGVLYFFVFRARKNQDKARNQQLEKLKPGLRVQTIGGILGTITAVSEKEITVKVDETNNVKIKFTRNAIHRVQDDDKTEAK